MVTTQTSPPPPTDAPLGASLRRSSGDRLLLGLCGGLARSAGVDATIVRVVTAAFAVVLLPLVVLAYFATAAILPRDDGSVLIGRGPRDRRDVWIMLVGALLGAPLVLGAAATGGLTTGAFGWPLVLVAAGVALGVALTDRAGRGAKPATAAAAPSSNPFQGTESGPFPDDSITAVTAVRHQSADAGDVPTFVRPSHGGDGNEGSGGDDGNGGVPGGIPGGVPGGMPAPRGRSLALPIVAAMMLIPALFVLFFTVGVYDTDWTLWAVMLALMAVTAAAGAIAIAIWRPSYLGAGLLVVLAALLGTMAIGVYRVGPIAHQGIGERTFRPASVAELEPQYVLGVGSLSLDLRDLKLRPGSRTQVRAELGFGEIRVVVPAGVRVVADQESKLSGLHATARETGAPNGERAAAPVIELSATAEAGEVQLLVAEGEDDERMLASESIGFWSSSDRWDGVENR